MKQTKLTVLFNGDLVPVEDLVRLAKASDKALKVLKEPRLKDNLKLSIECIKQYQTFLKNADYDNLYLETLDECIEDIDKIVFLISQIQEDILK